jgi:prophage antirepressor-like protein
MYMTEVLTFRFEDAKIRSFYMDDNLWFVAADVCQALGITNSRDAVARLIPKLDCDEKMLLTARQLSAFTTSNSFEKATTPPKRPKTTAYAVNWFGLDQLLVRSRKPAAERLRKWAWAELRPMTLKSGNYDVISSQKEPNNDLAITQKMFELQERENDLNHRWNRYNLAQNEDLAKQFTEKNMESQVIVGSADILVRHSSLGDDEISGFITPLASSHKYPPEWVAWRRRLANEARGAEAAPSQPIQH